MSFSLLNTAKSLRVKLLALIGVCLLATSLTTFAQVNPSLVKGTYSGLVTTSISDRFTDLWWETVGTIVIDSNARVSFTTNGCVVTGELVSGLFFHVDNFDYSGRGIIANCQDERLNSSDGELLFFKFLYGGTPSYRVQYSGTNSQGAYLTLETAFLVQLSSSDAHPVAAKCGSANGRPVSVKPLTNLCTVGPATVVSGTGPWTWTCSGINGGESANCSSQSVAAPANDNFASLQRISGSPVSVTVSTVGATKQPGEPPHSLQGGGASVWFAWTAPQSGMVTVDTRGSNFDTLLAAYIGDAVTALTLVDSNNDYGEISRGPSRIVFNAISGVDYKIAVDGYEGATGTASLNIAYGTPPGFINGVCGFSHNLRLESAPTTGLCQSGSASGVIGASINVGPWMWDCDGSNGGATASCSAQQAKGPVPVCTISPATATVRPNQSQQFAASCTNNATNYKWYFDSLGGGDGSPGPFLSWTSNGPAGRTHVQLVATNANGSSAATSAYIYLSETNVSEAYQGAWWAGQADNGWGLSLIQHGELLVAGWYYFDSQGQPVWAIAPGCNWTVKFKSCSGSVFTSTGSWLGDYSPEFFFQTFLGTVSFSFTDADHGTMSWVIDGVAGSRSISRMQFRSGVVPSGIDYSDIWWGRQSQNGWGLALVQQGAALAGIWYTYAKQLKPVWYLINGGSWTTPTKYSAPLYRATSSPLFGAPYNAVAFDPRQVGNISIEFTSGTTAVMTYTVDGVTQSKSIERLIF